MLKIIMKLIVAFVTSIAIVGMILCSPFTVVSSWFNLNKKRKNRKKTTQSIDLDGLKNLFSEKWYLPCSPAMSDEEPVTTKQVLKEVKVRKAENKVAFNTLLKRSDKTLCKHK